MPAPNSKTKRRLRLPRWSMKAMFVGVTVVCVFVGLVVAPAERQRRAVERLRKLHVLVSYDYEFRTSSNGGTEWIEEAEFSLPGPAWLRDLIGIDYFADVVYVEVGGPARDDGFYDEDLRQLLHFPKLRSFGMSECDDITGVGLGYVARLSSLTVMQIDGSQITKKGIADLKQALPNCKIYSDFDF